MCSDGDCFGTVSSGASSLLGSYLGGAWVMSALATVVAEDFGLDSGQVSPPVCGCVATVCCWIRAMAHSKRYAFESNGEDSHISRDSPTCALSDSCHGQVQQFSRKDLSPLYRV